MVKRKIDHTFPEYLSEMHCAKVTFDKYSIFNCPKCSCQYEGTDF